MEETTYRDPWPVVAEWPRADRPDTLDTEPTPGDRFCCTALDFASLRSAGARGLFCGTTVPCAARALAVTTQTTHEGGAR